MMGDGSVETPEVIANQVNKSATQLAILQTDLTLEKEGNEKEYADMVNKQIPDFQNIIFNNFDRMKKEDTLQYMESCSILPPPKQDLEGVNKSQIKEVVVNGFNTCLYNTQKEVEKGKLASKAVVSGQSLETGEESTKRFMKTVMDAKQVNIATEDLQKTLKGFQLALGDKKATYDDMTYQQKRDYDSKVEVRNKAIADTIEVLRKDPQYKDKSDKQYKDLAKSAVDPNIFQTVFGKSKKVKANIQTLKKEEIERKSVEENASKLKKASIEKEATDAKLKEEAYQLNLALMTPEQQKVEEKKRTEEKLAEVQKKIELSKGITPEDITKTATDVTATVESVTKTTTDVTATVGSVKTLVTGGVSAAGVVGTVGTGGTVGIAILGPIIIILVLLFLGAALIIAGGIWGMLLMWKHNPIEATNPNKHALKIYLALCGFTGNWIYVIYCLFKYKSIF